MEIEVEGNLLIPIEYIFLVKLVVSATELNGYANVCVCLVVLSSCKIRLDQLQEHKCILAPVYSSRYAAGKSLDEDSAPLLSWP